MHGNEDLLKLPKTAFLCSRKIPASAVLKCYDWAIEQREKGTCVVSGFHSKLEKDVLHYLLNGTQPIIIVQARGLKKRLEFELLGALAGGRLLILSPFEPTVTRVTEKTAAIRNEMMVDLAGEVVVGYRKEGGQIDALLQKRNINAKYL